MFEELEIKEFNQLNNSIVLIASENYPSQNVLNASGSVFQLPYAEGFAGKRYYQGCSSWCYCIVYFVFYYFWVLSQRWHKNQLNY